MAIKGTIIRKFNVRQTIKTTKAALAKGYRKVATEMQRDLKEAVSTPYPPASAPGENPHKRTGKLQRSIKVLAPQDGSGVSVRTIKYGVYLENGTSRMAARPMAANTIKANRAKYGKILRDTVKKIANQKARKRKARRR